MTPRSNTILLYYLNGQNDWFPSFDYVIVARSYIDNFSKIRDAEVNVYLTKAFW